MKNCITEIYSDDFDSVLYIADCELGVSYITKKDLVRFSKLKQILVFKQGNTVAGFITWDTKIPDNTLSFLSQNKKKKIFIQSIVTASHFQKQGIGSVLVHQVLVKYPDHHFSLQGWKAKVHCNIEKLIKSKGFKYVGEIKDPWKSACESQQFNCSEYNSNECKCSALVFEK